VPPFSLGRWQRPRAPRGHRSDRRRTRTHDEGR
jgi:hypothetical protein